MCHRESWIQALQARQSSDQTRDGASKTVAERTVGVLQNLLNQHRNKILQRWLDLIFASFPAKGHEFLRLEANQFHNPIGHTLRTETAVLLQGVIHGAPPEDLAQSLERIVKIRAVQDCLPSEATAFVFHLKTAIRETVQEHLNQGGIAAELTALESAIDRLARDAFDHYMLCKQKIFEIGARAEKMQVAKLLERLSKSHNDTGGIETGRPEGDGFTA